MIGGNECEAKLFLPGTEKRGQMGKGLVLFGQAADGHADDAPERWGGIVLTLRRLACTVRLCVACSANRDGTGME
jgi:hypothetical protein